MSEVSDQRPIDDQAVPTPSAAHDRRWLIAAAAAGLIVCVIAGLTVIASQSTGARRAKTADLAAYTVEAGPLSASVVESGTIIPSEVIVIESKVSTGSPPSEMMREGFERRYPRILWVIEEGARVKKGDLLVEIESSMHEQIRDFRQINLDQWKASAIEEQEELTALIIDAEADISAAELAYRFAQEDLKKYVEGDFPQQRAVAESDIKLAEAELERATQVLNWSQQLFEQGYLTETELQRDRLTHQRAQVNLESAQGALNLLEKYTYTRRVAELESRINQKKFLLAKTRHSEQGRVLAQESRVKYYEALVKDHQERVGELIEDIANCRIYAPADGVVVYATSVRTDRWYDRDFGEGATVWNRLELIHLVTGAKMLADINIHETVVDQVSVGQPVKVTSDAVPGKVFTGKVKRIAPLPENGSYYINPDVTVYDATVEIDGDNPELRPGMSCKVQILAQRIDNALSVPVQSVVWMTDPATRSLQPTVYVATPTGPMARIVELGLNNEHMVQVTSGLSVGERVMLSPPLPPDWREPTSAIAAGELERIKATLARVREEEAANKAAAASAVADPPKTRSKKKMSKPKSHPRPGPPLNTADVPTDSG